MSNIEIHGPNNKWTFENIEEHVANLAVNAFYDGRRFNLTRKWGVSVQTIHFDPQNLVAVVVYG